MSRFLPSHYSQIWIRNDGNRFKLFVLVQGATETYPISWRERAWAQSKLMLKMKTVN